MIKTIVTIICIVVSIISLGYYFTQIQPAQNRTGSVSVSGFNPELAYYLQTSNFSFFVSADSKSLQVKNKAGDSIQLDLSKLPKASIDITKWSKLTEISGTTEVVPPTDCDFLQIRMYVTQQATDINKQLSTLECKTRLDRTDVTKFE